MSIDEIIKSNEMRACLEEKMGDISNAEEHKQVAEWLRELQDYREGKRTCQYCKNQNRLEYERPCSLCKHNFMDKFEEVKTDDN